MRANEVRRAVFRIIEKYTDIKVKSETELRDEAGLDSIDQIQICEDLESEFGIQIDNDELFSPKIENATAGEIADMVMKKLNEPEQQPEEEAENDTEKQPDEASGDEIKTEGNRKPEDWKSIAEEYLISKAKVWCHDRNRWETESLTMLPDGNFVDDKWRLHLKEHHTAYVTLDDAVEAVRTTLVKLLDNKEWELEKLKQDAFLAQMLQELSQIHKDIASGSVYNEIF